MLSAATVGADRAIGPTEVGYELGGYIEVREVLDSFDEVGREGVLLACHEVSLVPSGRCVKYLIRFGLGRAPPYLALLFSVLDLFLRHAQHALSKALEVLELGGFLRLRFHVLDSIRG